MARTVRPDILAAWAAAAVRHGVPADIADTLALELERIAAGHGIGIDRLRPDGQPDADWTARPRGTGADTPDLTDVREAIRNAQTQQEPQ